MSASTRPITPQAPGTFPKSDDIARDSNGNFLIPNNLDLAGTKERLEQCVHLMDKTIRLHMFDLRESLATIQSPELSTKKEECLAYIQFKENLWFRACTKHYSDLQFKYSKKLHDKILRMPSDWKTDKEKLKANVSPPLEVQAKLQVSAPKPASTLETQTHVMAKMSEALSLMEKQIALLQQTVTGLSQQNNSLEGKLTVLEKKNDDLTAEIKTFRKQNSSHPITGNSSAMFSSGPSVGSSVSTNQSKPKATNAFTSDGFGSDDDAKSTPATSFLSSYNKQ